LKRPRLTRLIVCAGVVAMAGQIVFVRELLVVFSGNELSIGLILFAWLLAGAAGSFVFSWWPEHSGGEDLFPVLLAAVGLYLPLGILSAGFVRLWLGLLPGQIVAFAPLALFSLLILLPLCACLGFMFGLACRTQKPAQVYGLESAGAMIGGLAAGFVLTRFFNSLESAGILGGFACIACAAYFRNSRGVRYAVPLLFGIMLISAVPLGLWRQLEVFSLKSRWPGYSVSFTGNSIYGSTVVLQQGRQFSFLDNGVLLASAPDPQTAEESVHFVLLEHPHPQNVLLIGGGDAGLLTEILKHQVKRVDYVELDPMLVTAGKMVLPAELRAAFDDPRVHISNTDARFFVNTAREKYDCAIIHVGEPSTAMVNRFYTQEFFLRLRGVLKDDGVVSFGLPASESFLNRQNASFLRSIYSALASSFPHVLAIPGETAWFLASGPALFLSGEYRTLIQRAKERGLELRYVREYYLFSRMTPEKLAWFSVELKRPVQVFANRDFRPSAYYYCMISGFSRFRDSYVASFLERGRSDPFTILFVVFTLLVGPVFIRRSYAPLAAVAVTGFSAMAFQVILLFSFQVFYGFLFYQIGWLFTCFMAGAALGAWKASFPQSRRGWILLMAGAAVFYALLPGCFHLLAQQGNPVVRRLGSQIVFPGVSLLCGLLSGLQFVAANRFYIKADRAKAAGMIYGFDLIGSCLGAIAAGMFLIPVLGVTPACFFIGLLNLFTGFILKLTP
jgi:spermidine synthase